VCLTTQPSRSPEPTNVIRGLYGSDGDGYAYGDGDRDDDCDAEEYRLKHQRSAIIVLRSNCYRTVKQRESFEEIPITFLENKIYR
jgi:hypothetical protein